MKHSTGKMLFEFWTKRQNLVGTIGTNHLEQFDSTTIVDTVSMINMEESFSLNTDAEVVFACMFNMSSVSIHNQLQPRDLLHGNQAVLVFFKDGSFQLFLTNIQKEKEKF